MATQAGALIAAIGAKMAATFTGYSVIYGRPAAGGAFDVSENTVFVHLMQETAKVVGGINGVDSVRPLLAVTVTRQLETEPDTLESAQAAQDQMSTLRIALHSMTVDHATGVAPISGFSSQSLWFGDYTMTPSFLTGVGVANKEAITAEFSFQFSRATGGR